MTKRCKRIELDDPNSVEIIRLLNANPSGIKTSIIAKHIGMSRRAVQDRLQLLKNAGHAYMVDQGYHAKWIAGFQADAFQVPPEYIQASSIWQVGYRVARVMGAAA